MSDLELPLLGRGWTIELPLEDWTRLVEACQESIEMHRNEKLDTILRQALAAAVSSPPFPFELE